jgi:hypothetical protein
METRDMINAGIGSCLFVERPWMGGRWVMKWREEVEEGKA